MGALDHKLRRDIRGSAGILMTVVAIIAVGTGSFTGLLSIQRILQNSQRDYYRQYRFADVWIDLKKMPLTAMPHVADVPGIAAVESRVVFDVILDMRETPAPVTGRLISVPARGFDRVINGVHLVRGSGFSDSGDEEVIVGESFARAHHLQPGDRIEMILNRRKESFVIVGTAISPEYIYVIQGFGSIAPDPEHFGILYIKEDYARQTLGFRNAANQVVGQLVPGYEQDVDVMLEQMERRLAPYGVLSAISRQLQASNRFLSDEIRSLGITAMIMPSIFMFVAVMVLNVLMTRFAQGQRTIIGTLKAIGYSNWRIVEHYLSFGLIVGVAGGTLGIVLGLAIARGLMQIYKGFFQFPTFHYQVYLDLLLAGMVLSIVFAVAGTAKGVWRVLQLHPAEAMRSRPPERGGAIVLERFGPLWRRLGFRTHIALRSLFRNYGRTVTAIISTMLATAIIFAALTMRHSMSYLVEYQFERIGHSDVDLALRDARNREALYEARRLPGVQYAEPVFSLAADLRLGRASRRMSIAGLVPDHRLTTPLDDRNQPIEIPRAGLALTEKLAELLGARVGDKLELTPVLGHRLPRSVPVVSVVHEYMGLGAYADAGYLAGLVNEPPALNSIQLAVEPTRFNDLYAAVRQLPDVSGVTVRSQTKANIVDTILRTMIFSLTLIILFAGVIAFGSILNASLIEIADRTRDVATFRVLGYNPWQVAGIFFRENAMIFGAGLALGIPFGYLMVQIISRVYNTELFRMPVILSTNVTLLAAGFVSLFVLMAQWFVYRQIRQLDWLAGVQTKE
jgi:putative ABC transport system permease protein